MISVNSSYSENTKFNAIIINIAMKIPTQIMNRVLSILMSKIMVELSIILNNFTQSLIVGSIPEVCGDLHHKIFEKFFRL